MEGQSPFDDLPAPRHPRETSKYWCEECKQGFDNIREHIRHFDYHEKSPVEAPLPKKESFVSKLMSKVKKEKLEDKKMAEKTEDAMPPAPMADPKLEQMEMRMNRQEEQMNEALTAINKVSDAIADMKTAVPEPPVEEDPQTVDLNNGEKKMRFTIVVPQEKSSDIMKQIQEHKYDLEGCEIVSKSK